MQIRFLGGHGGVARGMNATSYLIDEHLLIDAGSVAHTLSVEEQKKIQSILISHQHLDHIKDLAFLCDNCFGAREFPFEVYSSSFVKEMIRTHLFNEIIWPDFSQLPTAQHPTIRFHSIQAEKEFTLHGYEILPVHVSHPDGTLGFIIRGPQASVLFTLDTTKTERIWDYAKKEKNLRAIVTEVSFPNRLQRIADISFHHTPQSLKEEIKRMPADIPIYLTHFKPNFKEDLMAEIEALNEPRLIPLFEDGKIIRLT